MSPKKLDGGTINSVHLDHQTGVITKSFSYGNGVSRPQNQRLFAEEFSLLQVPVAPNFVDLCHNSIRMKAIFGEKNLDQVIRNVSEPIKLRTFDVAGNTLSEIHSICRRPAINVHNCNLHNDSIINLKQASERLKSKGIETTDLIEYLKESKNRSQHILENSGLSWTHGDYWLNNIIGEIKTRNFQLNAVIDWELARVDTPYVDYAIVYLSIERIHPESGEAFWKGYGRVPETTTKKYFAVMKTLQWIADDPESNLESDFYQDKIKLLKEELQK